MIYVVLIIVLFWLMAHGYSLMAHGSCLAHHSPLIR
jgi:hypothetical protein